MWLFSTQEIRRQTDVRTTEASKNQMDEQTDNPMDGQTGGLANGWIGGRTDKTTRYKMKNNNRKLFVLIENLKCWKTRERTHIKWLCFPSIREWKITTALEMKSLCLKWMVCELCRECQHRVNIAPFHFWSGHVITMSMCILKYEVTCRVLLICTY